MFVVLSDLYLFTCYFNDYDEFLALISLLALGIITFHITVFSCYG